MATTLTTEEIARSHRWHAVECNNLAWRLSELPERTPAQDIEMHDAAHASAFHWSKVGTELHSARAKLLLGHVHAVLGQGSAALAYAQESYRYLVAHEPPDWERAFAHAVLAHAAHAAGETELHKENFAKAEELGPGIANAEDREIFFKTFRNIPRR
jgi:hypothetical protein